jgi:peroxiredoxin
MSLRHRLLRRLGWEAPLSHIEAGQPAPDFSLKSLDGQQVSLQQLLAKGPVALAFFKISCPVCQFTMPFLQRIAERYAGNGAAMVGISQDDARSTKDFNHEYGLQFPTLLDDAGYPVSNAYGLTNVPTLFLIAPDGTIKLSGAGFSKADLEAIATEFAQNRKSAPAPLFRPDEVIPAYKAG